MVAGYTTAAVINFSAHPPQEPVSAAQFMPNHRENATGADRVWDEETKRRMSDYQLQVLELAAKQKQEAEARAQ